MNLLPGERKLLVAKSLGGVVDGLGALADASGDPWAGLRVARYEQMAGRDGSARSRVERVAAASSDPEVLRACRAQLDLAAFWAGRFELMDLALPEPPAGAEPSGDAVLIRQLAAIGMGRLITDGCGAHFDWAEQQALTERLIGEGEAWLARADDPVTFAEGVDAALHAAGMGFSTERSDWSAAYTARVRRAANRHRLRAWQPVIDFWLAFALQHVGQYERSQALARGAIELLRREPGSPWLPFALASEVLIATLTSAPAAVDLTELERELVVGAWRVARPLVGHTCIHRMAASIADRGDPIGARNILAQAGPPETLHLVNEDRVHAYEIYVMAALAEDDRDAARAHRDTLARLMRSATQRSVLARVESRLGDGNGLPDVIAPAAASGTAVEIIRSRWLTLASAIADQDRQRALGELATLDSIAAGYRTKAVRLRAIELFHPPRPVDALTARQRDVAALAAGGLTNREIAAKLFLSVRTVEYYLGAALQALGLERRSQLANLGLADPAGGDERLPVAMTARQSQIAALVAAGSTNTEIAKTLRISEKTVEKHITALLRLMGASTRTAIAAAYLRARA
jgi:DNA-binding NarL/FixJ family response regulator